jgi:GTP-binding protein EngB required for normal cell division
MPGLLDRVSRFIDDVLLLPDDVREELEEAEDALESGDHALAAARFQALVHARPSLTRASVGLAQAREALRDIAGAAEAIAAARKLEPDDVDVAIYEAELALRRNDFRVAADAARDAALRLGSERTPKLARAFLLQARAELGRGRPDRAARELRKALSATPDDRVLRAELVLALAAAGEKNGLRAAAAGLDPAELDDELAAKLGPALHRVGELDLAWPFLVRGVQFFDPSSLRIAAHEALRRGELERAERYARLSVARGGGAQALSTLAGVELERGRADLAAEALLTAAEQTRDVELFRSAARAAPLDRPDLLDRIADALEKVSHGDLAGKSAHALARLARSDTSLALALAPTSDEPRAQLARASALLATANPKEAVLALDAWQVMARSVPFAERDRERVDALRKKALHALWVGPNGEIDLAAAIDAVVAFATERDLDKAARTAERLRDDLDRSLLLAVMGEFNAGKSTFINAFVGADVAPTGILPTTATLNLLRGGAERLVRVVREDGTTQEGAYEDLRRILKGAHVEKSAPVDHVEIVLPLESLERVSILDTPGSNALDARHEALAHEAGRRADAVLWIFDAGQAGKDTEAKTIRELLAEGRYVMAVLNKADRLSESEVAEIRKVLARDLPAIGAVLAISARQALRAKIDADDAAYRASGFGELLARLETDIFARSRELKRAAVASRLLKTVDEALATEREVRARNDAKRTALAAIEPEIARLDDAFERAIEQALGLFERDLDQGYRDAADEVIAFVRPRRNRFARHGVDPEDRGFLADVLERRVTAASESFESRAIARVRAAIASVRGAVGWSDELTDAKLRDAVGSPVALFVGISRGTLRAGALARFFRDVLPSAELTPEALGKELDRVRCDPRVDLRPVLSESLAGLAADLERARTGALEALETEERSLADRVYGPLSALRSVLAELRFLPAHRAAGNTPGP